MRPSLIRRLCVSLVAALIALGCQAAASSAETAITAQASADRGAFLAYARAPAQLGGLCLVDTGVNLNPDTKGALVERTAIDGGSGDDVSSSTHGTLLAMMAAAPVNGWGMVGTAPTSIRIVSVGVLEPGQSTVRVSDYAAGISACLRVRERYDVRAINLSLGGGEVPSGQGYEDLANAIERVSDEGVAVVAAAGNDDGGSVEYPAALARQASTTGRARASHR